MSFKIIPKREVIPEFDHHAIKLKNISYYPSYEQYEGDEITEEVISNILKEIPEGIEVNLSLIPYGEDDWLEVLCDGEWLALGYRTGNDWYTCYNSDFADTEELSPLESGGQSPVEKRFAIRDIEAGISAAEYFIRTGELYPGIDWAASLDE